jgi:quercetin dioxygenase-like cupin family protein
MKAYRLFNDDSNNCLFEEGEVPELEQIQAKAFILQTSIEAYELTPHPAPRNQFVFTLRGKLEFTVTSGASFVLEPGIVLLAEDLKGKGHSWRLLDGDTWDRVYVIPQGAASDHFRANPNA